MDEVPREILQAAWKRNPNYHLHHHEIASTYPDVDNVVILDHLESHALARARLFIFIRRHRPQPSPRAHRGAPPASTIPP